MGSVRTVEAQSRQIQQDLSEAEQAKDGAQVVFLRELVLLLGQKQLLLLEEDLVYLRAKAAGQFLHLGVPAQC